MAIKITTFLCGVLGAAALFTLPAEGKAQAPPVPMLLESYAFRQGGYIPPLYTCFGQNVSPDLVWTSGPPGTKSYALLMEDPDARNGTFTHWVVYNIPPELNTLNPRLPGIELAGNLMQGLNDANTTGYTGPCPSSDSGAHRYQISIYALDIVLDILPNADKNTVLGAMESHVIGKGTLMGIYQSIPET